MKERAAILFLCAGLLFCCAVGISMLFGCAGVALLVLGFLLQRDFPELGPGENAGDRFEPVPPLSGTQAPPRLRHRDGPRHVRIMASRPFDQEAVR